MINIAKRSVRSLLQNTKSGYLYYLKRDKKVNGTPRRPSAGWHNAVLKTRDEADGALAQLLNLGLFPHEDLPKNWDFLAALDCVLANTTPDQRVLDAGAEFYSVLLPWLALYGYRNLVGVNLTFERKHRQGPIVYEFGDITDLKYPDGSFSAVTCLSVIEHGVDLNRYFQEMSRILEPGGILITSTDYWQTPLDTQGKQAYGVPIHIFSSQEISAILDRARQFNLQPTGPIDLSCNEKVVYWKAADLWYTFVVFTLRKI